ncbi:MAG: hypothetical protein L6R35_006973 [Caloplaca aegaea]|nr:MAG: hypothetical protein L6R35_006973 [Caloplaca aegaea]
MVRFEESSASIHEQLLGATLWIFDHEHIHMEIRKAVYNIMPLLLAQCKPNQHPSVASSIATCLRVCCDDLMPPGAYQSNTNGRVISSDFTSTKDPSNADAYSNSKSIGFLPEPSRKSTNLQEAAIAVLCAALQYLPADFVPFAVRSKIDQTAVLTQSEPLLQASVLNPAPRRGRQQQQSSIVPFLARQFPQSTGTETLLRPRMAPLQPNGGRSLEDSDEDIVEHEAAFNPNSHLSSATPHDLKLEAFPTNPEDDKREVREAGFEPIQPPILEDLNPASNPPLTQQHASEKKNPPNKRTREPDSEFSPNEEPGLKRLRNSDQEDKIYTAPTTAEDLPPSTAPLASESALSPAPASAEPLAHLRTGGENIVDDDNGSDDSSIPSIDLTMDMEDEEDYESD